MTKYYAGIGSRETPPPVLDIMRSMAEQLVSAGYTLRSGGALGADEAFRLGSMDGPQQIFIPWQGFMRPRNELGALVATDLPAYAQAYEIARQCHPAWHNCKSGAQKLHSRNVMQVLGPDVCTPSQFVIAWTKDGKASGGTGQALRIAALNGIPIYNIKNAEELESVQKLIASITPKPSSLGIISA